MTENNVKTTLQKILSTLVTEYKLESVADDIYIAGGAIRDLLADKAPADFDIYIANKASADVVKKALSKVAFLNANGNYNYHDHKVHAKLNVILNEEFNVAPDKLILEFNFTCNTCYFHQGVLKMPPKSYDNVLVFNPTCKYPVGCFVKIPRMLQLGYVVNDELVMMLLGKVLPLGIKTQEEFVASCPNLSAGMASHYTQLPTAKELFDASPLGESLS